MREVNKDGFDCQVIADSKNLSKERLTTMVVTFPRIVLAEFNTHRMFSRNSASSRAIPTSKMIQRVEKTPFVPLAFQATHKGMQGTEYLSGEKEIEAKSLWLKGSRRAVSIAKQMVEAGITKQLINRILEPYLYHTVIVSATDWDNFFELRCPKYRFDFLGNDVSFNSKKSAIAFLKANDFIMMAEGLEENPEELDKINTSQAEIHIQRIAEMMYDAYQESRPTVLNVGDYHMPFGDKIDHQEVVKYLAAKGKFDPTREHFLVRQVKIHIAIARCARVSYLNFEGKFDINADVNLYKSLKASKHWSPFEHVARYVGDGGVYGNFNGAFKQVRYSLERDL